MRFTAQEEYGLRCMVQLARHEERGPLSIQQIAKAERLTPAYVGKLLSILRKGGLVASQHGATGGYRLPRPAADMNVGEVLDILGGRLFEPKVCEKYPGVGFAPASAGVQPFCVHTTECSIRSLWAGLDLIVGQVLHRTRLADLVRGERTLASWISEQTPAILEAAAASASLRPAALGAAR